MALYKNGGSHRSSSPPSCAGRHLVEPLFQRKLAGLAAIAPKSCHGMVDQTGAKRVRLVEDGVISLSGVREAIAVTITSWM